MNNPSQHKRINDGLFSKIERPTLQWLAVHSPHWLSPDIYTVIGITGSLIALVGYFLSRFSPAYLWLATFGFVVNWYGDSMDGTLARYRHIERPIYGYFIDHSTDAISQVLFFTGLGITPYVSFSIACLALVGFLLLSVLVYIRTYVAGVFKISYDLLGPTEARVIAILLNTAMFCFGRQGWALRMGTLGTVVINPYDGVVFLIGLLLLYFFLSTWLKEATRLAKAAK